MIIVKLLELANLCVWGVPALTLILCIGAYLTFKTGFAQFCLFPRAIKNFLLQFRSGKTSNGVSSYQALCTALAATVGTGNIAGVAGAIAIGGPGAVFWMWMCAILGMVTKYAEATLAVRYRQKNASGEYVGGPMYIIRETMGKRWQFLAVLYCFFGVIASFGVGNSAQVNAVLGSINSIVDAFGGKRSPLFDLLVAAILAVIVIITLIGGVNRVGNVAEALIPFVSVMYLVLGSIVLIIRADAIPEVFSSIIKGAFAPQAVTGGVVGSVFLALRTGAARGVFTNEAGMGTAAIAHASSNVSHPVEQGLMGIMEVFLDTIVICTMTAVVILCSKIPIKFGCDSGVSLTTEAFSSTLGDWVSIPLAGAVSCFAIATILGWSLYGVRCAQYLFGDNVWKKFSIMQAVLIIVSAILSTSTVWMLAETVNGLMMIPNLIVLAYQAPELKRLTEEYKKGAW